MEGQLTLCCKDIHLDVDISCGVEDSLEVFHVVNFIRCLVQTNVKLVKVGWARPFSRADWIDVELENITLQPSKRLHAVLDEICAFLVMLARFRVPGLVRLVGKGLKITWPEEFIQAIATKGATLLRRLDEFGDADLPPERYLTVSRDSVNSNDKV